MLPGTLERIRASVARTGIADKGRDARAREAASTESRVKMAADEITIA